MNEYESNIDRSELVFSALEYGKTGCGKTMSGLYCPKPVWFINTQQKDPRIIHSQSPLWKPEDFRYSSANDFEDLQGTLNDELENCKKGEFKYKTVFFDDLTFGQTDVMKELQDSRREVLKETKDKDGISKYRGLIDFTRTEQTDYGSLGELMVRITQLLTQFSKYEVLVICTSIEDSNAGKRYGGGITIGPFLQGKIYPQHLHGLFDFIGYIKEPFKYDEGMNPILPQISFISQDDKDDPLTSTSFLARCSSDTITRYIKKHGSIKLDWNYILEGFRK
jgi:hypothetical protein